METNGMISPAEASAALASVERSRARVAWAGYPAWYWLVTAAGFAALPVVLLLPDWWGMAGAIPLAAVLIMTTLRAGRARGICEGWVRSAMGKRDRAVLYGPPAILVLANTTVTRFGTWPPIVTTATSAALIFVLFAGTGLMLSARVARR